MQRAISLLVFTALVASAFAYVGCPSGYSAFSNKNCYRISKSGVFNRTDAVTACANDGGYLASINDAFTQAFVNNLTLPADYYYLWLGIQCFGASKATCINDDGTRFGGFDAFGPGLPNGLSTCVFMATNIKFGTSWANKDCSADFGYLCEVPYKTSASEVVSANVMDSKPSRLVFNQN